MSGKGVWTYIVLPITNGPPSCPRRTPVENVQATLRFLMLPVLISFKVLYRVDALFLFAIPHSLSSSFTGDGAATADESVFAAGRLLLVQPAANTGISVATISVDNLFMLRLLFGHCVWVRRRGLFQNTRAIFGWVYSLILLIGLSRII